MEEKIYFGLGDDGRIIDECKKHIEIHSSIDLRNFLAKYQKDYPQNREFSAAINRVRHAILKERRFKESTQKEASGLNFRIMFNPDYSLEENIKDTNDSIRNLNEIILPQNFTLQRNLAIVTIIVAAISALAIIFSTIIASRGVTSSDIKHLDTLLEKHTILLDSMQKFQKGIDSSLMIIAKDTAK